MASRALSLVPVPIRSGTTTTSELSYQGTLSGTSPSTLTPGRPASESTSEGGRRPTTQSSASGTRDKTSGQMSSTNHLIPSTFGGKSSDPKKSTRAVPGVGRSEEHTSELQSLMRTSYAVF